jgi:hypothetical protein
MAASSKIIFDNQHYTACELRDGSLVVTHKRKRGGVRLIGSEAAIWLDAIKTVLDASEGNALCRVIVNA